MFVKHEITVVLLQEVPETYQLEQFLQLQFNQLVQVHVLVEVWF